MGRKEGANKRAQQIKVIADKPDNLSSMVGENRLNHNKGKEKGYQAQWYRFESKMPPVTEANGL